VRSDVRDSLRRQRCAPTLVALARGPGPVRRARCVGEHPSLTTGAIDRARAPRRAAGRAPPAMTIVGPLARERATKNDERPSSQASRRGRGGSPVHGDGSTSAISRASVRRCTSMPPRPRVRCARGAARRVIAFAAVGGSGHLPTSYRLGDFDNQHGADVGSSTMLFNARSAGALTRWAVA
jgi:hypothetical protein